jgi:hypothetical protein
LIKRRYRLLWQDEQIRPWFLLLLSCALFLTPTLLLYQGLSAHRYLLPIYLTLSLLTFTTVLQIIKKSTSQFLNFLIITIGLLLGNCWIYPDKIAQGWDATLAHLPYYRVRSQMMDYLYNKNIPLNWIGTAYPEIGPQKFRDLSSNENGFAEKNLTTQSYILYSNVMNDFRDAEIDSLQQHWQPVQRFERRGVWMTLYRK